MGKLKNGGWLLDDTEVNAPVYPPKKPKEKNSNKGNDVKAAHRNTQSLIHELY